MFGIFHKLSYNFVYNNNLTPIEINVNFHGHNHQIFQHSKRKINIDRGLIIYNIQDINRVGIINQEPESKS